MTENNRRRLFGRELSWSMLGRFAGESFFERRTTVVGALISLALALFITTDVGPAALPLLIPGAATLAITQFGAVTDSLSWQRKALAAPGVVLGPLYIGFFAAMLIIAIILALVIGAFLIWAFFVVAANGGFSSSNGGGGSTVSSMRKDFLVDADGAMYRQDSSGRWQPEGDLAGQQKYHAQWGTGSPKIDHSFGRPYAAQDGSGRPITGTDGEQLYRPAD